MSELGKAAPYGGYIPNNYTGFVSLGTSHDTSEFAVTSISCWWNAVGKNTYPAAKRIYVTCDGGGSNGSRSRSWKYELQQLANDTGLEIMVSHYPPGTSKWSKIEHRMFCYISKNWQGQPLIDIETVISLISNTTTKKGLSITCQLDEKVSYPYYAACSSISGLMRLNGLLWRKAIDKGVSQEYLTGTAYLLFKTLQM